MKRILLAACIAGCMLGLAAQTVLAESVKVPVNKISGEGVGEAIGFVLFDDDGNGGMHVTVELAGIAPGEHGMHVHENASCAPAQKDGANVAGLAAGGHYDPTHAGKHEGPGKQGHKGDLPLITADAQQNVKAMLHVPNLTTKDIKGRSLMIHAGGDNYSDQPAPLGGGGARIACGVIN